MSNQKVEHFSHPHSLSPLKKEEELDTISCNACQRLISESFHGCPQCKYYLHDECLNAPRSVSHPSHPSHHLTLLPFPTYASRGFLCDGCGLIGNGLTYSCSLCSFDLHTHCALSPQTIIIPNKHQHELQLVFDRKLRFRNSIFRCDICQSAVDQNWLFYCSICDYGTHLHCGSSDRWPLKLQVQPISIATNSDTAQLHHHEASPKDHQPTADHKDVVDVRNDRLATKPSPLGQKCDARLEHLSVVIDEVTEIQIMVARLQNLLSKTYMTNAGPQ